MIFPELASQLSQLHSEKKQIVLVTGVFDVVHYEHLNFLKKAKSLGDFLIVAIESDKRVRQLKGEDRPVNSEQQRKAFLEKTGLADVVRILPDDFGLPVQHEQLIAELRPKFLAVSSHSPFLEKKRQILEKYVGEVVIVLQHNPTISTTQILAARNATAGT